MDRATVVLITLIAYKVILIGIGFWAERRTKSEEDYFLGGRGLGPLVAAISYTASASSAWALLGLSGAAFTLGLSVVWILIGVIAALLVTWYWIGPRMLTMSHREGFITLTDFLAHDASARGRGAIAVLASVIIVISFTAYVAAQFQGAGSSFNTTFGMSIESSIFLGGAIIVIYTLMGGFWAVSVTDTLQGLLMAVAALLLPIAALIAVGGPGQLIAALGETASPAQLTLSAGNAGLAALGMALGFMSVGLGTFGQPHLMNRFMALRDQTALRQARHIAVGWYVIVYGGMVVLGLSARVLIPDIANPETLFFVLTTDLFPTIIGGILLAAVLSAIMSTADSQLLVAASAVAHDLRLDARYPTKRLLVSRVAMAGVSVVAIIVAVYLPEAIFSRVLFAWNAIGAAFGPVVFLRLAGWHFREHAVFASILTGFALTVLFYLRPDSPGDVLERLVPFLAAGLVLVALRRR